ncbi:hypothetical protein SLS56_007093 [Neofusicoccum ribis]|uniref:Uncharacterized protein n=1 Tax=Neofusicoccum ribis TaxID=45134 RepID=A0ABR3SPH0_9PEZI
MLGATETAIKSTSDGADLESTWKRLLEEYTDRELTYLEADKSSLADAEAYTLVLEDEKNPAGQLVSASVTIKAYCAEVEWRDIERGGPAVLGEQQRRFGDSYLLYIDLDDPDEKPPDGVRYLLAALTEDNKLDHWEGLVLSEVETGRERRHERVGHFELGNRESRLSWRDDIRVLFEQEKSKLTLV